MGLVDGVDNPVPMTSSEQRADSRRRCRLKAERASAPANPACPPVDEPRHPALAGAAGSGRRTALPTPSAKAASMDGETIRGETQRHQRRARFSPATT
jgi:hypothetical protein